MIWARVVAVGDEQAIAGVAQCLVHARHGGAADPIFPLGLLGGIRLPRTRACYAARMGTATFVDDFKQALELEPVVGSPNLGVIHFRPGTDRIEKTEMTPAEWDKFERDIADAFERVSQCRHESIIVADTSAIVGLPRRDNAVELALGEKNFAITFVTLSSASACLKPRDQRRCGRGFRR